MKLFFTTIALILTSNFAFSQGLLDEVKKEASDAKKEVSNQDANKQGTTNSITKSIPSGISKSIPSLDKLLGSKDAIMSKLQSVLALTGAQNSSITNVITDFLKKKGSILPLSSTNKTAYNSKSSGLKTGMMAQVKKILTKPQFAKFLKMKPKSANDSDPMSNLFY